MRIEPTVAGLREALAGHRPVGLVPTMGNLHAGHIALVRQARERLGPDATIVASIFVNRLQFGAGEDFDKYPRTFEGDVQQLEAAGCDLVFAPLEADMYPEPQTFQVVPDPLLADPLEGNVRPGHFAGMCTVVMKLFTIVWPDLAAFGKKDYQQLMLVRTMVRQFALPIEILGCETVREADGLAMSSRNGYLTPAERAEAPSLSRVLRQTADAVRSQRSAGALDSRVMQELEREAMTTLRQRGWQPDYFSLRRRADLGVPDEATLRGDAPLVLIAAARLGTPRLLDNLEI